MKLHFQKYSATGNDFIVIDDRECRFPAKNKEFIAALCRRRTGVGADGLLLVQPAEKADFKMRYFNADGGEAEMCGNGARAIVHYAYRLGIIGRRTRFEVMGQILEGEIEDESVSIRMNQPGNLQIDFSGINLLPEASYSFVEIGVPHLVVFVPDVNAIDINRIGARLAHLPIFRAGTNVDFVALKGQSKLQMRTFERGVEAETLSCGTGATAAAILSAKRFGYSSPVQVVVPGGVLTITFSNDYRDIWLSGPIQNVFSGELEYPAKMESMG